MFPCVNPSRCGVSWHAVSDTPACTQGSDPVRALGDVMAVRTQWASKTLWNDQASARALAVARVLHRRSNSVRGTVSTMTVRAMDDIFEATVRCGEDSANVTLESSRPLCPPEVYRVKLHQRDAPVSQCGPRGSGRDGMPDELEVSGRGGTFWARAMIPPSQATSTAAAVSAYNNGTFWLVNATEGYENGLDDLAHSAFAALRKAFIGALLTHMKQEIIAAAFAADGDLLSPEVMALSHQLQHIGTDYGLTAVTPEGGGFI